MNVVQLEKKLAKQDILIIDDTPDNLRILSSILIREGYNVRKALNWQMASTACEVLKPDLIILDIMMPEVDGYEVCRRFKSNRETADIPIIFISALDDVFDKVRAFQAGGVDYIIKPFEFQEVIIRVKNQLALRNANLQICQLNQELEQRVRLRTQELETAMHNLQLEINSRKQLQDKLLNIALHDALTGLPNRVLFLKHIEQALTQARTDNHYQFAVLFLDCDRFKIINDSLGHFIGDELLIAISKRIKSVLSPFDILSRFSGDEFAIFLGNITSIDMAIDVAERILHQLTLPFHINHNEIFMNASIGINFARPEYYQKPEYLLRDADTAMYRAKAMGRARYHVFDPIMHEEALQLLQLESDLHRALERQEIQVHYQPIIATATGQLVGFEALARWQHPTKGLIMPTDFIPAAEEMGLIYPINLWILETACRDWKNWQKMQPEYADISISVNLSPRTFTHSNIVKIISKIICTTGVNPKCLELEITENVLMKNCEVVKEMIDQLKQHGLKIVIDDFGTGYSSLSYLHDFPLDALKIDKSFVSRMHENPKNMGFVPAMIGIAHSMGMYAVAEGVETQQQLEQLRNLNCDRVQGFLFAPALKPESVLEFLANHQQVHQKTSKNQTIVDCGLL